jgi:hypothetical protein
LADAEPRGDVSGQDGPAATGRPRHPGRIPRPVLYAWAAPYTLVGILVAALTWFTGGIVERRDGTVEAHGAFARSILESPRVRASAMTLGHVVLARNPADMMRHRMHERGHVRQYERLGPLFLPAYLLAAIWAVRRGGHYYRDNWFECDARRYRD